jgi:MHS family alpha-ketoglutarate permease-like MFS transporter
LCRYGARGARALERLARAEDSRIAYRMKHPLPDSTTHLFFTGWELLRREASLVPPPRANLTRLHGVFAPGAKLRPFILGASAWAQARAATLPLCQDGGVHQRLLSIFGGSVGNLIEWYDFYIYSAFSLYFAKAFFPSEDPLVEQLNSAGVFALGFLIRPVGGWLMGLYADLRGRRAALSLSVFLMCLGSLVIAVCPTYGRIGVLAPTVLILARLLQGLSLGGEYGTSATYLSEVATSRHRGFYSSFQYVTLIMGQLLATVTLLVLQRGVLTGAQLEAWGWRIPFLCGAMLAVLGFLLRRNMVETEAFQAQGARGAEHRPMRELLRHPQEIALVAGLTMGGTLAFYTYTVYMQKFLVN